MMVERAELMVVDISGNGRHPYGGALFSSRLWLVILMVERCVASRLWLEPWMVELCVASRLWLEPLMVELCSSTFMVGALPINVYGWSFV